jgi:hypothetical protein
LGGKSCKILWCKIFWVDEKSSLEKTRLKFGLKCPGEDLAVYNRESCDPQARIITFLNSNSKGSRTNNINSFHEYIPRYSFLGKDRGYLLYKSAISQWPNKS